MNPRYARAVAGWAQRWHGGDPAWVHERFGFAPDDYGVDLIPRKTAAGFILAHHYSRSAPAMRKYRFGLFHLAGGHPVLCGVAILTIPPRKEVLTGVFPRLEALLTSRRIARPPGPARLGAARRGGVVLRADPPVPGGAHQHPEPGHVLLPGLRRRNDGSVLPPGHAGTTYQA